MTFKLTTRSIVAALALNAAWGRLRQAQPPTAPGFLKLLSVEAQSDLVSRLIALDESPANPSRMG